MDLRNFGLSDDDLRELGYSVGDKPRDRSGPDSGGPAGVPSPRRRASPALRIWLATLVALPVVGWASGLGRRLPDPVPAAAPDTSFSSARALAQLVEVARRPHPTGSPDLTRVRSVLLARLSALGLEPEVQVASSFSRDGETVRAATVRNVVARIPGSSSTGAIALIAHYDGAPLSPGGGDNGVGVAVLLETARTLTATPPLRNDVLVVFTDADELGLLGTRTFLERHPAASDVALAVSLDAKGSTGPALLVETLPENGALVEALAGARLRHEEVSLARTLGPSALGPDHSGVPVVLTVLGGRARDDQPSDARDLVSERTLQHGGEELLALVRRVGAMDVQDGLEGPEQTYFSLPRIGLVHYPVGWVLFVSLGLILGWGLVGLTLKLRRATRNGVIAGVAVGASAAGLSGLAASALFDALRSRHEEYGLLATAFYRDGPHELAMAAVALALTSALYGIARRWCRIDEILFGALLTPLALAVWLTFASPDAAGSVQWPLAVALLATAILTVLGPRRGASGWAWSVVLLLSAAILLLVVPSLELVARSWTLVRAGPLGALFGASALLLLPLMEWLQRPKAWATPLLAVAAGGALVVLYLPGVQGAVRHPEPTALIYLADEAASPGPSLRGANVPVDTSRVRTMLGDWLTVPGPGEAWARSWAATPPTGSTDPGVLLIGPDSLYEIVGTGPDSELEPPTVDVVSSAPDADRRSVVISVRSGLRGEMIGLQVPEGVTADITGVGGRSWSVAGMPVRTLVHWGAPDGGTVRVGLSLPLDARETELLVLEHHLRPAEVLGDRFFQRADSLVANAAMGSDRIIQRTRVRFAVPDSVLSPLGGEEPPGGQEPLEAPEQVVRD